MSSYLATHGISHLTTPPQIPEHNGYSDRRHRHIVETSLALLHHASMPLSYWPNAFSTAAYLINRLSTPTLNMSSPFTQLFHRPPTYSKLKVFGCLCYPWLRPYSSHKLETRSKPCVFLGYSLTQSANLCFDLSTSKIYVSRHVKFIENIFSFTSSHTQLPHHESDSINQWLPPVYTLNSSPLQVGPRRSLAATSSSTFSPSSLTPTPVPNLTPTPSPLHTPTPQPSPRNPIIIDPPLPPTQTNIHRMLTRTKIGVHKPTKKLTLTTHLQSSLDIEPNTVTQALKDPRWSHAISDEYKALLRHGTWDLVPVEQAHNVIGCKWIFQTKRLANGYIDRFKAPLVAKGFY